MSEQVLATKLYTPPSRPNRVVRSRLIQRLDAGFQQGHRLTLISAPAGFGKTTLATDWAASLNHRCHVSWVSLDETDNEPVQFLVYLLSGLQSAGTSIGQGLLPVLKTLPLPPMLELMGPLINQIAAADTRILLVLDDYHVITSPAVHQMVRFLLDHQPNTLHTLISTREDPPLPLARLRGRDQITEIRQPDLRFTPSETEAFFRYSMGLDIAPEAVATLETRTEGWIAGLQLAALALQEASGPDGIQAFVADFAGSNRFVVDYLVAEVLQRVPAEMSDFLMRTSILDRLCAPLCDAVLGESPQRSALILEQLDASNLFLIPLDSQREWYRYHHLFRDFLRVHLARSRPEAVAELHRRASQWYEAHDLLGEAVHHALESQDWALAADMVERHAMRMIGQSQVAPLRAWCAAFPEAVKLSRPGLCLFEAWSQVLAFRSDNIAEVEARLAQAERAAAQMGEEARARLGEGGAEVAVRAWIMGHVATLRSQVLLSQPGGLADPQALITLSRQALDLLPATEKTARSIDTIDLAHAYMATNDCDRAVAAFDDTLRLALEAGNGYSAVTALFYQARIAFLQGQPGRGRDICSQGRELLQARLAFQEHDFPAVRGLDVALSCLLLENGDLAAAEQALAASLDIFGWASWMEVIGYANLARLREFQQDIAGALSALRQIEKLGPQFAECARALSLRCRTLAEPNDLALRREATAWTQRAQAKLRAGWAVPGVGPLQCDLDYLTWWAWCHLQIILGQPHSALAFIEPALSSAVTHGLKYRIAELSLLESLARFALGDGHRAWEALNRGTDLAQSAGLVRVFDQGPALRDMLRQVAGRKTAPAYLKHVLAELDREGTVERKGPDQASTQVDRPTAGLAPGHPDALSERELEVLRLIAAGLSNAEIGAKLFIAPATVKRHINNLYSKLAVRSRTQAVDQARKLRLLN